MALIDFSTAGLPHAGDTNAFGGGLTSSSVTNEVALQAYGLDAYAGQGNYMDDGGSIVGFGEGAVDTPLGHPVVWWFGLAGVTIATMYFTRRESKEERAYGIVSEILIDTMKVIVGITLFKMFFGIYKFPGLSEIVEAA